MQLIFSQKTFKNICISNFLKICPVGAQVFNADRQTAGQDEANSHFLQFCKSA